MGKGSKPRPVDRDRYNKNHDKIDWSETKKKKDVKDKDGKETKDD